MLQALVALEAVNVANSGTALSAIPCCKIRSMRAIFAVLLRFVMEGKAIPSLSILDVFAAVRSWVMLDSLRYTMNRTLLEVGALYSFDSQCKLKAFIFDLSAEV